MRIELPDASVVYLDEQSLQFGTRAFPPRAPAAKPWRRPAYWPRPIKPALLAKTMARPSWDFGACFRRVSDTPRYSPRQGVYEFDVRYLTDLYRFERTYQGGTFCSSTTGWHFLDGGIVSHNGYGFASHRWVAVDGAEALRAVCLFFGIKQPRSIRGEPPRRPLADLLEQMSAVPLWRPGEKPLYG